LIELLSSGAPKFRRVRAITNHHGPKAIAGILGGMGPAAGAEFLCLFVEACTQRLHEFGHPITDRAYPEHWVAQLPFPDRTAAIQGASGATTQLLNQFIEATSRLAALGVTHVAIPCNTAHAWHALLAEHFPSLKFLHIAHEVARALSLAGHVHVGLLATQGTYQAGVYQKALATAGIVCCVPDEDGKRTLMRGIYDGVKAGNIELARASFADVAARLRQEHAIDALILGCTEIPLGFPPGAGTAAVFDAGRILAAALAARCIPTHNQGDT
jgi:aspartate racemase